MPRDRKASSSDDSGASSSGDETSGSESSASDHSQPDHKKPKKDSSSRSKGAETTPVRNRRGDDLEDHGVKEQKKKGKATVGSGELSSSDGEHVPRAGPRSTVVQKVTPSTSKDKSRKRDDMDKNSPGEDLGKDKREDADHARSRKRSRSVSPRNRDSNKRAKDDRSYERGSDRREDRRQYRDDRDSERDRNGRRDNDRRRADDRRRDDDRRSDRSRRETGRDRYERRRERDGDRREDLRSERDTGERRRDRDDREKNRGNVRREENKENRKDDSETQKRKAGEVDGEKVDSAPPEKKTKDSDIMTRTGGAYIPPAKLRMMQAQITDKSSVAYQRMAWEALKKSINGLINKVNVSNIIDIVRELFQENIVRGRGLLARSVIQAQAASPTFTHVYAALVAIINTKFPQNGELILQRLILQFKQGYRRNDKNLCLSSTRFIAHLVNQQVAHEVIALEILTLLLENTTEDSVEVAISFLKECGQKLTEVSPRGINAIFERLRTVLHEAQLDKRVQYMVEVMFAVRKDSFKAHPSVISDLDLVEEDDQFTHLLQLDDVTNGQNQLNVFKADDDYLENEDKYKELKKEILDEGSTDEEGSGEESGSEDSSDDDDDEEEKEEGKQDIIDQTETNMVALRRTIYLTIQSSLDFEECAHKLLKMELKPGQEVELCYMILDCCAQLRTYEKFFGLLAQRFCQLDKKYVAPFQTIFHEQFETIHRLDTSKLRNVAKFFAHLLHTDAISWSVMSCMKLTEEDTTSASRIFIKILFLELSEYLGLPKLNNRLRDPTLQEYFEGILPRNNPKDTRFAINFFTTIGLGGLTEDLREHLKGISKQLMQQKQQQEQHQQQAGSSSSDSSDSDSSDSDSSDSSESGSSDSSDSDSDESDSSSDSEAEKKRKKSKSQKVPTSRDHSKDRVSWTRGDRKTDRHNDRQERRRPEGGQRRHSRGDENRPRIEDKLLKLSLPKGMSLVDPPDFSHEGSPPSSRRSKKSREKQKRKKARANRRLSNSERGGQRRPNSEREARVSGSYDQVSDRDQSDRGFYRGSREDARGRDDLARSRDDIRDREDMGRGRNMSPPITNSRQGRHQDGYNSTEGRSRRREQSPVGGAARWDGVSDRQDGYSQRRADRRDVDMSPPPRGDRHALPSSPARQDRRDFDVVPPSRRNDRMDVEEGSRRGYDRRDLEDGPHQMDLRYDSPPRGSRRRDALTPPPRVSRRELDSPPHHLDSPPRRSGRGDMDRNRDDLPRSMERGRGDMDRNLDRNRADLDRNMDRGRGEMDRGRGDGERNLDRNRVDLDRGRNDMDRGRGEVSRSMERGRGDGDWDRDMDRVRNVDRSRNDMERGRGDVERGRGDIDRNVERGRGNMSRARSAERVRDIDRGRAEIDRSLDRGRGDMERVDRRGDMDRGRGDVDHTERGRGDRERGRMDVDRSRDDLDRGRAMDRGRDGDRGRDRSGGRLDMDSPVRQTRRDIPRSPPLSSSRDMNHSDSIRDGGRRRGDQFREVDGRGGRSLSPPARKDRGRDRNDANSPVRRSLSREKEDRRKTSRNEGDASRARGKEKRRR